MKPQGTVHNKELYHLTLGSIRVFTNLTIICHIFWTGKNIMQKTKQKAANVYKIT